MKKFEEKIASMKTSAQIELMADSLDKLAARCDALDTELRFEKLCTQVMDSGQSPWASRAETLEGLRKLASDGRLDAFKVSLDLMPGSLPKFASGLSSETDVDAQGRRVPNVKESRARVMDAVMSGAADG